MTSPVTAPRRGRVLVIDDEASIRRSVRRVLEPAHDVVEAANGHQGLAALDEAAEEFDLVLCDLEMPEMGGDQFWAELNAIHPTVASRVVFVTGGARTQVMQTFVEQRRPAVLDKPFQIDALRALAARRVVERG
ncbi:MAG: response regulator [Deltaproteobacteria bacterium]|nr:response regulator [Nannocystaceae bacterium]